MAVENQIPFFSVYDEGIGMKLSYLAGVLLCATFSSTWAAQGVGCQQCHADWKVLGEKHPPVTAQTLESCSMCHGKAVKSFSAKVHTKHADKMDCTTCHELKDGKLFVKSATDALGEVDEDTFDLYKDFYLSKEKSSSHLHLAKSMTCDTCHATKTPQEGDTVDNQKCESCHGTQAEIAKKTIPSVKEQNPHQNHQGKLDCVKCHAGHTQAKSYCLECHQGFNQVMPETK